MMINSSRNPEVSRKPDALFSCHSESSRNMFPKESVMNRETVFESGVHSVFRFAHPANVGKSLLDGKKGHLLNLARSEIKKPAHQVGSLNNCINELQQQAYAQRLDLENAHHGYVESRREQVRLQEELSLKEKSASRDSDTEYTRDGRNEESSLKNCESSNSLYKY